VAARLVLVLRLRHRIILRRKKEFETGESINAINRRGLKKCCASNEAVPPWFM
jgi:hypothetical protein